MNVEKQSKRFNTSGMVEYKCNPSTPETRQEDPGLCVCVCVCVFSFFSTGV
jgi:hypothetical protein